ncbi:tetratricopeptide repeat protein [Paraburkholderia acidisoli]|uniref:Tetratricopeptide repeat protein n=1 Tax=Paraburkholderia acidisoli TaxID=2571748 RepID=A0A7Z2GKQ9_9BURK|nr:tetratricopeptide repeat protein [Paraburkholderia acidisoli]QGZ63446.1 tetratricopeptide repeat protein [Paraburkholderia acidisoli]
MTTLPLPAPAFDDLLRAASALCEAHRFADALALLDPCVGAAATPEDAALAPALDLAALSATGAGDAARAQALWLRCITARPDFASAYRGLATVCTALGQLGEAEMLYRRLLSLEPNDADARSNLAVVLLRLGRHPDAEAAFRALLAQRPDHADAHYNLALLLKDQQRHAEAESGLRAAIAANPRHAKAYNVLGTLLRDQGRIDDADAAYREALRIEPQFPEALNNLALVLKMTGELAQAEFACRLALTIRPQFVDALNNLGCVLNDLKRPADAEAAFREALAVAPDHAEAMYNLGVVLHRLERLPEAEAAYRETVRRLPRRVEAYNNLACVLMAQKRPDDALDVLAQALAVQPDFAEAHFNVASIDKEFGRFEAAEAGYRRAVAARPDYGDAKFRLATLLISMGRFEEGFARYECRYTMPGFVHHATQQLLQCPMWQGESLAGKSLLLWQEDGLGDMLQFGRYARELKARGAKHITFVCMKALHRLMRNVAGIDAVLDHDAGSAASARFDCWVSPISVPHRLGTTLDTIPAPLALEPEPALVAHWAQRLATLAPGPRVGIVWRGNPQHNNDAHRSLPSLAALAPLWNVPDLRFVSLQKGRGEDEAQHPPASLPLLHLGTDAGDLADTAAIVAQLDLVICVDTSIAHLAGSLGTPCWVLLPNTDLDWRWLHGREDTPWYPGTMRLFRQRPDEVWTAVVERVRVACAERFA